MVMRYRKKEGEKRNMEERNGENVVHWCVCVCGGMGTTMTVKYSDDGVVHDGR